MSLSKKFKKSHDKKWCLRFKTSLPDQPAIDGVVTHIWKNSIVLIEESDFAFDGVLILPKKCITGYRDGKYERCSNAILHHNGQIKKISTPKWLDDCRSIKNVLAQCKKRDIWPAVEIYHPRKKEAFLYIGPLIEVGKKSFKLQGYDAAGKWEQEYALNIDRIIRLELKSRYTKAFNAYMRQKSGGA